MVNVSSYVLSQSENASTFDHKIILGLPLLSAKSNYNTFEKLAFFSFIFIIKAGVLFIVYLLVGDTETTNDVIYICAMRQRGNEADIFRNQANKIDFPVQK